MRVLQRPKYAILLRSCVTLKQHVFLYRDAIPTVDSFSMAFLKNPVFYWAHRIGLDNYLIEYTWMKRYVEQVLHKMKVILRVDFDRQRPC